MVTAASTADLAVILVDARKGVVTQTRRHSYLAHLLGIRQLVVAINKMDLVGWSRDVFARIAADYLAFAGQVGIGEVRFVPMSALNGDMVVERGGNLGWYEGPTLLGILEAAPPAHTERAERFRFPVQWVVRPKDEAHHDFRGYAGRVESGRIAVGEEVVHLPSGRTARVKALRLGERSLDEAVSEQSVTLLLDRDLDVSRGDLIARAGEAPAASKELDAVLCWLHERPLEAGRRYLVRHGTREVKGALQAITWRIDVNTLERAPSASLALNDIARVTLKLAQPVFADPYAESRATGAFIVVDEATNDTVGAGMIQ
jgi:sulfate adenylyltransferase subunit 1